MLYSTVTSISREDSKKRQTSRIPATARRPYLLLVALGGAQACACGLYRSGRRGSLVARPLSALLLLLPVLRLVFYTAHWVP